MKTMKVKDLIKLLKQQDQELKIVIASDEEGNGFGTITNDSLSDELVTTDGVLILYPWEEMQLEDFSSIK